MPRTMAAGYCAQELERVANHLLPPEIIAEIGIVVDTTVNSAAAFRSHHDVIEGLAAHLASILGVAGMGTQHRPRPGNAAPQYTSRVPTTNGGSTAARVAPAGSGTNDDMVLCPGTVKVFATTPVAAPPASAGMLPERRHQNGSGTGVFLPARHHDHHRSGTGVFMPLAGAYRTRPFKSRSNKGLKPPRLMRKEAAECRCSRVSSLH